MHYDKECPWCGVLLIPYSVLIKIENNQPVEYLSYHCKNVECESYNTAEGKPGPGYLEQEIIDSGDDPLEKKPLE